MNFRKAILNRLIQLYHKHGADGFAQANSLPEYARNSIEFTKAANQLLQKKLIDGASFGGKKTIETPQPTEVLSKIGIKINPVEIERAKKELTAWYRDPKWLLAIIIAFCALIVGIIRLFIH